jgi:hypothetical protein
MEVEPPADTGVLPVTGTSPVPVGAMAGEDPQALKMSAAAIRKNMDKYRFFFIFSPSSFTRFVPVE